MVTQPQRRLFTVDEYYRMAEIGILGENDRTELIEGQILAMVAIGSHHAACVNRLLRLFAKGIGDQAVLSVQNPVRLSDLSEPEPDLTLLRPNPSDYAEGHPTPKDVLLLVEVADASADYDRTVKAGLYAKSGVPELWIIDLDEGALEIHRLPSQGGYQDVQQFAAGASVSPVAFPDLAIDVGYILAV